jgi:uncharacterized protein YmfQ (DUF2313 family)
VARLTNTGGQSIPYLIQYAKDLGYTITVTEYTAFTIGSYVGTPLYGDSWRFVIQINSPTNTVKYLSIGDGVGEPLASWGNLVLICELFRVVPAQSTLIFNYS